MMLLSRSLLVAQYPLETQVCRYCSIDHGMPCTGFGSQLMAKWGFKGQGHGLGAAGQGVAEAVDAYMRPRQLGLGA